MRSWNNDLVFGLRLGAESGSDIEMKLCIVFDIMTLILCPRMIATSTHPSLFLGHNASVRRYF